MSERHGDSGAETVRETLREAPDDQLAATIDPVAETERAPFRSPREIVLLVMLLLALLLVAVATGRGLLIRPGASGSSGTTLPALPTRIPNGNEGAQVDNGGGANVNAGGAPVCSPPGGPQVISSRFRSYYDQYGGLATFGRPISAELLINGRPSQWFERALLEDWANQAPPYTIQGGLIGFQFTKGIPFPRQAPFVSQPGVRYFAETGHGVREPFLSFWEQRGGLTIFGYPISDEVQERLPGDTPGQTHTVQYFERVRLEMHPEQADDGQHIQIGLLGSALCLADSKPNITNLVRPTPVPVP
jgi:hypothetical protein